VKRISSSLTVLQKLIGLFAVVVLLVAALASRAAGPLARTVFAAGAIVAALAWWRYLLPAATVFMDESGLYVSRRGTRKAIPFKAIVKAGTPFGVRNPPIIVNFTREDGSPGRVLFVPSIRENGGLFGEYKLKTILQNKIAECQASAQGSRKPGGNPNKTAS
jgi:hypothetical protein